MLGGSGGVVTVMHSTAVCSAKSETRRRTVMLHKHPKTSLSLRKKHGVSCLILMFDVNLVVLVLGTEKACMYTMKAPCGSKRNLPCIARCLLPPVATNVINMHLHLALV